MLECMIFLIMRCDCQLSRQKYESGSSVIAITAKGRAEKSIRKLHHGKLVHSSNFAFHQNWIDCNNTIFRADR